MVNASVRYGASIRKRQAEVRRNKTAAYACDSCGRESVRRIGTGIWKCRHCGAVFAGGAYTFKTAAGESAKKLVSDIAASRAAK